MVATVETLRRDVKLFVDRDDLTLSEAEARFAAKAVTLAVGPDVCGSPTLQAALFTAANTAARWCGKVELLLPGRGFTDELRLPWRDASLTAALRRCVPKLEVEVGRTPAPGASVLRFGASPATGSGLQVTFDGWCGGVQLSGLGTRLAERERCPLAGVLAGGLAVSEVFMRFASVNARAEHRDVLLSLWRPDLGARTADAIGPKLEFLPTAYWLLGLGHLGQAYGWAISMLPYASPESVALMLQDFDTVQESNLFSQVLTRGRDVGLRKTRVVARFLRERGFDPAVVDRRFDENTRRHESEPELALCGFDGQGPRHLLEDAGFCRVVESGLGGTFRDFDDIGVHTFPQSTRSARDRWPEAVSRNRMAERLAESRQLYQAVERTEKCGHVALAERSVAVPFVGAVASSLVLSETLRMLHDGERYSSVSVQLSDVSSMSARRTEGGYRGRNLPGISYQEIQGINR